MDLDHYTKVKREYGILRGKLLRRSVDIIQKMVSDPDDFVINDKSIFIDDDTVKIYKDYETFIIVPRYIMECDSDAEFQLTMQMAINNNEIIIGTY